MLQASLNWNNLQTVFECILHLPSQCPENVGRLSAGPIILKLYFGITKKNSRKLQKLKVVVTLKVRVTIMSLQVINHFQLTIYVYTLYMSNIYR